MKGRSRCSPTQVLSSRGESPFAKRQTRLISGIEWLRADEAAELKGNH